MCPGAHLPISGMKAVWLHLNAGAPVLRQPLKQRGAACGAAGTQMNIFGRLFRVARSYANSLGAQPTQSCIFVSPATQQFSAQKDYLVLFAATSACFF